MKRYRYIVVKYPSDTAKNIRVENGLFKDHLPIHELLSEYHWERLDDNFVLVQGEYPIGHHSLIASHPHALMLPSVGSNKALYKHGIESDKMIHATSLRSRFNLDYTHTMADLLDAIEGKVGPLLLPSR